MTTRRFEYATLTIVLLVLLRLAIGWHFFKEGVSHHTDRAWSSEGFLKQAKGPLADMYQSVLPDFHGWNRLMLAPIAENHSANSAAAEEEEGSATEKPTQGPAAEKAKKKAKATELKAAAEPDEAGDAKEPDAAEDKPAATPATKPAAKKSGSGASPAYAAWLKAAASDWMSDAEKFAEFYHFSDKQKAAADTLVAETVHRMKDELDDYEADIRLYRELVARAQAMRDVPGAQQIPNEVARVAAAQQNPLGERGISGQASPMATTPAVWQSNAQAIDQLFHDQLRGLLTDDQKELAVPPNDASRLHRIDTVIAWTLMIAGGCLIVGLFTRLAAVVGALFLLSIICVQPPWLATSVQTYTYNQMVEMLALFALATTPVGRWAGLDYFIHRCCSGCCRSQSKVVVDPPKSNLPPGVNMPPAMKRHLT